MVVGRAIVGTGIAAAIALGCAIVPAFGADDGRPVLSRAAVLHHGGIGSFTPASADPKLAAIMARSGLETTGFRFTPSTADRTTGKAVTVAVRARTARGVAPAGAAPASPVALAPIAYNLGAAVGWKRFALSGDLARVDLGNLPGSRERLDVGLSYNGKRAGGQIRAGAQRPIGNQPRALMDLPNYSVDVGGSYSISRNVAVTAGMRYQTERDRLPQLTDNRRDSQSVYVGTAFRF